MITIYVNAANNFRWKLPKQNMGLHGLIWKALMPIYSLAATNNRLILYILIITYWSDPYVICDMEPISGLC